MSVVGPSVPDQTYENGVLAAAFDEPNTRLNVIVVAGTASLDTIGNDENFCWSSVFDPATGTLRVVPI